MKVKNLTDYAYRVPVIREVNGRIRRESMLIHANEEKGVSEDVIEYFKEFKTKIKKTTALVKEFDAVGIKHKTIKCKGCRGNRADKLQFNPFFILEGG